MLLLHIDSSVLGGHSASRPLTAQIVETERARHPGIKVVHRDLAAVPFEHLSGEHLAALQGGAAPSTQRIADDLAAGIGALEEFLAADVIVIGAPMYNFGIPSQLKAWIDRIAVAGKTFKYGPGGVVGLAGGKRVIIASTRGGMFSPGTPYASLDHQESYLKGVLGFLGITDIQIVRAEGLAMTDNRDTSLAAAKASIAALA